VFLVLSGVSVLFAVTSGVFSRWVPTATAVLLIMLAGYLLQLR